LRYGFIMKNYSSLFSLHKVALCIVASAALLMSGCSSIGLGISVPIGPFGSVSIGGNSNGGVSVGAGVGVGGASVGVGGTIPTAPWGSDAPQKTKQPGAENLPPPAPLPAPPASEKSDK
jgi:hypothetical protein